MAWMDLRRHVFAYILNRMSVFTDLDSDQLEISGSSFQVKDLAIDPDKISSPGLKVQSASAAQVSVELSTLGIHVKINELSLEGSVVSLKPDLGLSTVLEQTRHDLDTELAPKKESSYMTQKISEIALAQLKIEVNAVVLVLHVGQLDIAVDIGLLTFEKQKITFDSINVTCKLASSEPSSPQLPPVGARTVRFAELIAERLGADSHCSSESEYASASETFGAVTPNKDEELAVHISGGSVQHDFPLQSVALRISSVKTNALPLAGILVECLNVVFDMPPGDGDASNNVEVGVLIDELWVADCTLSSEGAYEDEHRQVLKLRNISFSKDTLQIDEIDHPAVQVVAPLLSVDLKHAEGIKVTLAHPIALDFDPAHFAALCTLAEELVGVAAHIRAPEADEPTKVTIELADCSIKVGDLSVLVLSQELDLEHLKFSEILVTAGVDRMVATGPEISLLKKRVTCQKVVCQVSENSQSVVQALVATLQEHRRPARQLLGPLRAPLSASTTSTSSAGSSRGSSRIASWGISVDSVVVSGFGAIISTPLMASYSTEFRAKLKPELVWNNHRFNTAVQLVYSDMLVVYVDVLSAQVRLEPPAPMPSPTEAGGESDREPGALPPPAPPAPFIFPFVIDVFIKGQCTFISAEATLAAKLGEVLNANLKDDWMNVHLPLFQVAMVDGKKESPLLDIKGVNIRGNFSKSQFALTVAKIVGSSCADSFHALQRLVDHLRPPAQQVQFSVDGPDGLNVFADIEDDAFAASTPKATTHGCLQYVESYYPKAHSLEENFVDLVESMQKTAVAGVPLAIQEDYLLTRRSASPKVTQPPAVRVKLLLKSVCWDLYDGYDLSKTRRALKTAVERVSSVTAKLNDLDFENDEAPIVGDLMFNSVYIGARLAQDKNFGDEIDNNLGTHALQRSGAPKVSLRLQNLKVDTKRFVPGEFGETLSDMSLTVEEFMVRDLVPTSNWKSLLSYDKALQGHKRSLMATFNMETIHSHDPELRITANVAPLRVQLDQDTLEFLTRFFEFEPEQPVFDEEQEFLEPKAASLQPFIQRFELADLHICLDYKPKKVDYAGLRSGHAAEFMNLFVVEKSSLVLRHVILHGVSGFSQLGKALNNTWTPDVRNNQLINLLRGLGPLKSIIQVAGGIKKFVVTPVKEYRRESSVASGVRRGSTVLAKNTANELVRLGVRVINGPKKHEDDESALID